MLESTLPDQIKPVKFAKRGAIFDGAWRLDQFKRLTADAVDTTGEVRIQAEFSFEEGAPTLSGKVKADVQFECQRCLEPVTVPLEIDLHVAFVSTEERAAELSETLEGVLLQNEEISIVEVVEEELILALPIVAYHDECESYEYRTEEEKAAEQQDESKADNPFSVLEQLKGKLKSDD